MHASTQAEHRLNEDARAGSSKKFNELSRFVLNMGFESVSYVAQIIWDGQMLEMIGNCVVLLLYSVFIAGICLLFNFY
jgi:hypothetical protein